MMLVMMTRRRSWQHDTIVMLVSVCMVMGRRCTGVNRLPLDVVAMPNIIMMMLGMVMWRRAVSGSHGGHYSRGCILVKVLVLMHMKVGLKR